MPLLATTTFSVRVQCQYHPSWVRRQT